ncbi:putative ribonuclease H-like domain-containing protein [Tanacetum coccineum]|uniref:Ribonuclease H-like domain-containing protein n=1 Tax=Tanacetum coccineum TaxID=301880 RepID=A0ABQ5HHY7_9ASTR
MLQHATKQGFFVRGVEQRKLTGGGDGWNMKIKKGGRNCQNWKERRSKAIGLYDVQREELSDASVEIKAYTQGLKKVEAQLVAHQQGQHCTEPSELVSEPVVNESNIEVQPKVWSDAPIIEEYESDSDDECVTVQTKGLDTPSFANKQVKTSRENVKNQQHDRETRLTLLTFKTSMVALLPLEVQTDESNLWALGGLGHVYFKNLNRLVKGKPGQRSENQANILEVKQESNQNTRTKDNIDVGDSEKEIASDQDALNANMYSYSSQLILFQNQIIRRSPREDRTISLLDDLASLPRQEKEAYGRAEDDFTNLETVVNWQEEGIDYDASCFIDSKYPEKVYKVVKALYGLHQAPRAWYATLSTFLLKNGYRKMSSMGELTFFLGLQVKQKPDGIFISQDKYVAEILKKFDFASVKTAICALLRFQVTPKDLLHFECCQKNYYCCIDAVGTVYGLKSNVRLWVSNFMNSKNLLDNGSHHLHPDFQFLVVFNWDDKSISTLVKGKANMNGLSVDERDRQLANISVPLDHFPVNSLTSKVFSFMIKRGKRFSGKVTPLFDTMLVQPTQDEGASSERLSIKQPSPSHSPTGENPNESLPDSFFASTRKPTGENLGDHSSNDTSLSGNEDEMTLQNVYDLLYLFMSTVDTAYWLDLIWCIKFESAFMVVEIDLTWSLGFVLVDLASVEAQISLIKLEFSSCLFVDSLMNLLKVSSIDYLRS